MASVKLSACFYVKGNSSPICSYLILDMGPVLNAGCAVISKKTIIFCQYCTTGANKDEFLTIF